MSEGQVSLDELFDDVFVRSHMNFANQAAMSAALTAERFTLDAGGDPDAEEVRQFFIRHSSFDTWEELMKQATARYLRRHLRS